MTRAAHNSAETHNARRPFHAASDLERCRAHLFELHNDCLILLLLAVMMTAVIDVYVDCQRVTISATRRHYCAPVTAECRPRYNDNVPIKT